MNKPEECMSNDLQIAVKAKTRPRFKAGAELSKTVNRVEVNVDQQVWEEAEEIAFEIKIIREACKPKPCN
jgi:hypothetical protein